MASVNWLTQERKKLCMSQEDLAHQLELHGISISRSAISAYEVGRANIPLEEPEFRAALASSLQITVPELLELSGYEMPGDHSREAHHAANIVDRLSPERRRIALNILEALERS